MLWACAPESGGKEEGNTANERLWRGLVSVGEDELVARPASWQPASVAVNAENRKALQAQAEAALAAGRLYQDEQSALPIWLALQRFDPDDMAARDGLSRALIALRAEGDAALERLEAAGSQEAAAREMAHARQVAEVLEVLAVEPQADQVYLLRLDVAERLEALLEHGQHMLAAEQFGHEALGALTAFREVLHYRPHDVRASQGMAALETAMLTKAFAAAGKDDYAQAESWLTAAGQLRPRMPWAVEEARRRIALQREARVAGLHAHVLALLQTPHAFGALQEANDTIDQLKEIAVPDDWRIARLQARHALATRYGLNRPGERFTDVFITGQGRGPELVVVPHGSFRMGAPQSEMDSGKAEWPQHEVVFQRGFAMTRTEITVGDFARFIAATGYRSRAEKRGYSVVYDEMSGNFVLRNDINWRHDYSGREADLRLPVLHVDIRDAEQYALWLSESTGHRYRLPSEAEFEYALRAGSTTRYPWGEAAPPTGSGNLTGSGERSASGRGWSNAFAGYDDRYWGPAPVASFRANAFDLHDMAGNVSEWVHDCWHQGYRRAPADGAAWYNPGCRTRVVRGASWSSSPAQARSAWRMSQAHDITNARTGFRLVRVL